MIMRMSPKRKSHSGVFFLEGFWRRAWIDSRILPSALKKPLKRISSTVSRASVS